MEQPVKRCPRCRSKVKRLLGTGAGIIFKGSGFYQTDYRSSNYKEAEKKEKTSVDLTPSKETKETKKSDSSGKAKEGKGPVKSNK